MKNRLVLLFVLSYCISIFICLSNKNISTAWAQSDSCTNGQLLVIDTVNKRYKCMTISSGGIGSGNVNMTLANNVATGTTTNKLVKITGAPSTAIISSTADTDQVVGVCTSGCGTTGSATIAILGQVQCVFDGSTTAGNFVVNSDATNGNCEDAGSSFPTADRAAIGRVLSTNVGAGTYSMELMTPDIAFQNAGNGKSKPGGSNTQVQYNNNNQFGGTTLEYTANLLEMKSGTTAQDFRVYKTTTNNVRFSIKSVSNIWELASQSDTTEDDIHFILNAGFRYKFTTTALTTSSAINLGSTSERFSQFFGADANITGEYRWNNLTRIQAGIDGFPIVRSDAAAANATGWIFGTNDTSGVRLKRNGTVLEVKLGGDSAYSNFKAQLYTTATNCADSAGAAACSSASAGAVVIDAAATTVVVSTTAVTANSRIMITEDPSLATELGITCNTTLARTYAITARTAATSFTITASAAPVTNPACISYTIMN